VTSVAHTLVLLDWNGTVMDDVDRAVAATNDATAGHGLPAMDRAAFQASFTLPMKTWLRGMGIADADADEVERRWNDSMKSLAPVRPNVAGTLAMLRQGGVVTGVVTAADEAVLGHDIRHNRLTGMFDHLRASVSNKADCLKSLRHLGTAAYYVGDTAYDMVSAREAGYVPISVGGGYQHPDRLAAAGADHHLDSFEELLTLLQLSAG
jgi:phosphoglycolate phosphatase